LDSQRTLHFDDPQFGTCPERALAPSVYETRATIKINRASVCGWSPQCKTLETALARPRDHGLQQGAPNPLPPPRWIDPQSTDSTSILAFAIE